MQKIVCPCYLFCNFHLNTVHWNSGKSAQITNRVVKAIIEYSRSIKLIQIHEIVLITWSRTAEFN